MHFRFLIIAFIVFSQCAGQTRLKLLGKEQTNIRIAKGPVTDSLFFQGKFIHAVTTDSVFYKGNLIYEVDPVDDYVSAFYEIFDDTILIVSYQKLRDLGMKDATFFNRFKLNIINLNKPSTVYDIKLNGYRIESSKEAIESLKGYNQDIFRITGFDFVTMKMILQGLKNVEAMEMKIANKNNGD